MGPKQLDQAVNLPNVFASDVWFILNDLQPPSHWEWANGNHDLTFQPFEHHAKLVGLTWVDLRFVFQFFRDQPECDRMLLYPADRISWTQRKDFPLGMFNNQPSGRAISEREHTSPFVPRIVAGLQHSSPVSRISRQVCPLTFCIL